MRELARTYEILSNEGSWAFMRAAIRYITKMLSAPYYILQFKRRQKGQDLSKLVDLVVRPGGIISAVQDKSEILELLKLLKTRSPRLLIEIGTLNGGTLFLFSHVASDNARIISIDLPGGIHGGGYPFWKIPLYKYLFCRGRTVTLVRADSHHENTIQKVRNLLQGEKVDFLFIDGDHTYEGVSMDFHNYKQMVKPGGIIAFHDIVRHRKATQAEVDQLWSELKKVYRYDEFVANPKQEKYGIGVIYV
jgi:predicted O-methyltransferase YrrM